MTVSEEYSNLVAQDIILPQKQYGISLTSKGSNFFCKGNLPRVTTVFRNIAQHVISPRVMIETIAVL